MPSQAYAFEEGGPKRLTVGWSKRWRSVDLYLDDVKIYTIEGGTLFGKGQAFPLPDGSLLHLKLARGWTDCELYILRDGQPLPESVSNAEARLQAAYFGILVVAALNIALGWAAWAFQVEFLQSLGHGFQTIIYGAGFLILGQFTARGSLVALLVAIGLYGLDSLLGWASSESSGFGLLRLSLLGAMAQGIGTTWATKARGKGISAPGVCTILPVERAPLWRRFLAHVTDLAILGSAEGLWILAIGLALWLAGSEQTLGWFALGWGIIAAAIPAIYFAWSYATSGQTVGKRALKIKVISIDGSPPTWGKGLLRAAGYVLSGLPLGLGFLWPLWDANRQTGHDKIAGTLVVPAAIAPEQLQGAVEPSETRRRRNWWLLGLGVSSLLMAVGLYLEFERFIEMTLAQL